MGGSSKKVTVGYKYYLGMHMVLCHGPVDKITRIRVDERTAWSGSRSGGRINILKNDLFGGESREGGISGAVDVLMGEPTQGVNDYLLSQLQNRVPAFRGVVSAVLRQVYVGLNPYLKPWEFRLTRVMRRQDGIPQWYPETAPIPVANGFGVRQRLLFSLDTSGSMEASVGGGMTRLDIMKQNMIRVLDELQYLAQDAGANGVSIDVALRTLDSSGPAYTSITASNVAAMKSWVLGLSTGNYGTRFAATFSAAKSWFSSHTGERRNALVLVTDGEPYPLSEFSDALSEAAPILNKTGTWSGNNEVESYVVNIDLDNTAYSAQMDNTSGDGVPVVGGSSADELYNAVFAAFMGDTVAMNVVHAIRECLTDPVWGMGLPESDIDETSFRAAAKRLRDERLGVCFLWDRQKTIQDIVQELLKHADAALYVDRKTGLFTIKLVRDDFVKENLLHLTEENIIKVEDFNRVTFGELATAVTVNYDNAMTGKTASIRVEDIALANLQQAHVETTLQYPCYPDAAMAGRAAQRQLRLLSSQLASCTVHAGRAAASLTVGDPVCITWPEYGLEDVVFRVTSVAYGDGKSNRVKLSLTEDVFAIPTVEAVQPAPPEWEDPARPPNPATRLVAFEAPYFELVQRQGQEAVDAILSSRPEAGYVGAGVVSPGGAAVNSRFFVDLNDGQGYQDSAMLDFCPGATLTADVTEVDTVFPISGLSSISEATPGTWLQIDQELCAFVSATSTEITVRRGVLDTVPTKHLAGSHLVFWDEFSVLEETELALSETALVKVAPVSGSGVVALADIEPLSVEIKGRAARPYPPACVKVNGQFFPGIIGGSLTVSWRYRNRTQQTAAELIDWYLDSDISPEAGTTVSIQVTTPDRSVLLAEQTGLTGNSASFDVSAFSFPEVLVTLKTVRGGLECFQPVDILLEVPAAPVVFVFPDETYTPPAGNLIDLTFPEN